MMANFPRYAIYYAAARGTALDRFGSELLGYDARSGDDLPFPDGVPSDWRELTEDPRKYGFHATLKAPMTLAADRTETELLAACADFASTRCSISIISPVVSSIDGFVAVIPAEPSHELQELASACVVTFDPFRATLSAEDRVRRNPLRLTPRQRDYLDRWGYPYVMEEFRFHMTITGKLEKIRRELVLQFIQPRFVQLEIGDLKIDRIVLFKQIATNLRFQVLCEWPLKPASLSTGRPH
jgi:putative phosphonate metabolism protein